MATCLTYEGIRIAKLIQAVKAMRVIAVGAEVPMLKERPATYIGPVMEDGIQMHEFRLFDGIEVALEVPALTNTLEKVEVALSVA
jgi:hypothetical protein